MVRHGTASTDFKKLFEQLAMTHSRGPVFNDFLDYSLLALDWRGTPDFTALKAKYSQEELQKLHDMLDAYSTIADNDGEGLYDGLGDLFMEYLSSDRAGQFFTPTEVCTMMATMIVGEEPADGISVCDPACGSGRTLLAAAKINRKMVFYGADVDITCCKMAALNMIVNTLEGEIAWMNSLTMDHWKSWHIRRMLLPDGQYIPYYFESGAGETHFIQRLQNSMPADDVKVNRKQQIMLF